MDNYLQLIDGIYLEEEINSALNDLCSINEAGKNKVNIMDRVKKIFQGIIDKMKGYIKKAIEFVKFKVLKIPDVVDGDGDNKDKDEENNIDPTANAPKGIEYKDEKRMVKVYYTRNDVNEIDKELQKGAKFVSVWVDNEASGQLYAFEKSVYKFCKTLDAFWVDRDSNDHNAFNSDLEEVLKRVQKIEKGFDTRKITQYIEDTNEKINYVYHRVHCKEKEERLDIVLEMRKHKSELRARYDKVISQYKSSIKFSIHDMQNTVESLQKAVNEMSAKTSIKIIFPDGRSVNPYTDKEQEALNNLRDRLNVFAQIIPKLNQLIQMKLSILNMLEKYTTCMIYFVSHIGVVIGE